MRAPIRQRLSSWALYLWLASGAGLILWHIRDAALATLDFLPIW